MTIIFSTVRYNVDPCLWKHQLGIFNKHSHSVIKLTGSVWARLTVTEQPYDNVLVDYKISLLPVYILGVKHH